MRNAVGSVGSVLVLGGTSEIGLAIAGKLAPSRVVLAGRHPDALSEAAAALTRGAPAVQVETTAFDADDVEGHHDALAKMFAGGDLDVVVVAFGRLGDQSELEHDNRAAAALAHTNYVGAVSVLTVLADRMRAQGHGAIVVLSSVAGERVRRANYVYASTKAGLDGFTQGLADAMVGSGVQVLTVRPGFVHTKMTAGMSPAPLSTTPDVVADQVLAGLAKGRHTVWAPGPLRVLMSGLRHAPRPVWRRLPG